MSVQAGWQGRFYEDFEVGHIYEHTPGRTILDSDNVWFTLLTMNPNPIHFDAVYASKTEFGKILVDSTFTLALVTGLSVNDISRNAVNLGWDNVRLPNPVFHGDTITARSTVLTKRESKSRPHMGIISVETSGFNQDNAIVISFERTLMVYTRDHAPTKR